MQSIPSYLMPFSVAIKRPIAIVRVFGFLVAWFFLAFSLPVNAQAVTRVTDLYSFEVVVANTSKAERKKGLVNALEQVMVRATGNKRIGTHPEATALFEQAEGFLQQYGYSKRPVSVAPVLEGPETPPTISSDEVFQAAVVVQMETLLQGRFEPAVLGQALRQAGLPVWGARRPLVLLLSSLEDGQTRRAAHDETVRPTLVSAAALRGVPIQTSEPGSFGANTISKGDSFALEDAAQAAGVDYVHWSRISLQPAAAPGGAGPGWVVEAALYQSGELVREWYFNANSEEVALRRLVDEMADWMAGRYAVVSHSGGNTIVGLYISGVDNLRDYAKVQTLVQSQSSLEKTELVAVGRGSMVYRVTTRSDARQFEYGLGLTRQLKPAATDENLMSAPIWLGEIELYYRLSGN